MTMKLPPVVIDGADDVDQTILGKLNSPARIPWGILLRCRLARVSRGPLRAQCTPDLHSEGVSKSRYIPESGQTPGVESKLLLRL